MRIIYRISDTGYSKVKPDYTESRLGDIKHSLADISKAMDILWYSPKTSFEQGIKKTIAWHKDNKL